MQGLVFDIQRYSSHDGPGIRTTVFMKGCPLGCFWCHNPESISLRPEVLVNAAKCIGCGACIHACPCGAMRNVAAMDRARCTGCGACASACPAKALSLAGKLMDCDEIVREILKDKAFYDRSGGGVTFSGGEALLQSAFVAQTLKSSKEQGIHTAVDTSGAVPYESIEEVLPHTDLFLYDIKTADAAKHAQGCGTDNARVLENLERLCRAGANVLIRVPVIPGFNDDEASMRAIGDVIAAMPGERNVELLRFHRMGAGKYESLGLTYRAEKLAPPADGRMENLATILRSYCAHVDAD